MSAPGFAEFLTRVRAGDQQAAADLVRQYEPLIRREIRLRLTDPSVTRLHDDEDVCQSVLASFFVRATLGQYDLNDPAQLRQLLLSMARNKLAGAARHQTAQKRGGGRDAVDVHAGELAVAQRGASPSAVVADRELLEMVRRRLSDEERQVAELRSQGLDWSEVARQLGGTPDGRRMQFVRALDRVGAELGLESGDC